MSGSLRSSLVALFCACLILGTAGGVESGEVVKGDLGKKLDEYLTRVAPFGFSGAVLVARDGEIVLDKGYGLAIRSGGVANTPETVFSTGSITEQFTAAAIMVLELQGKLNTNDRLNEHLGGVPQNKVDITLHHLLTHTAGVLSFTGDDYTIAHRDETVKKILDSPLVFTPGERIEYSNAGYSLLAAVIEEVSGRSYEEFLQEEIFGPAGMKFTGYRIPAWDQRVVAHYYVGETDNGTPLERDYPFWNLIGNGGILSTTGDMYRWHMALMGDKVPSDEAKAKMFAPGLNDYAYGWDVLVTDHGTVIQQDGATMLGNAAEIRRYMDAGTVTIVFCNADGENALLRGVRDKIERIIFGGVVALPPAAVPLDRAELRKFDAVYDIEFGGTLTLRVEGDGLRITPGGHGALNLLAFPEYEDLTLLHNEIDEKSWMIFNSAAAGDYSLLNAEVGDEERAGRFRQLIEMRLDKHKDDTGRFRQVEVIGTLPGRVPGEVVTSVLLRGGSGGEVVFRLHWSEGEIVGLSPATNDEPASMHLVPLSPTRFGGYHIGWGKGITVDFEVDRHNSVRTLTIPTGGGDVVAVRR